MYQHILLPTDGSELSAKANVHAIGLAKSLGARLTVFHVSPEYPTPIVAEGIVLEPMSLAEYESRANDQAQRILGDVRRSAESAGVRCETLHRIAPIPWEAIVETARVVGADVITMASHGAARAHGADPRKRDPARSDAYRPSRAGRQVAGFAGAPAFGQRSGPRTQGIAPSAASPSGALGQAARSAGRAEALRRALA